MLSVSASGSFAFDRISIGLGGAEQSSNVIRLGLQKDFGRSWYQTGTSELTGYWEASISHLDTSDKRGDDITAYSLSPVFTYRFKKITFDPYIEAGVGISHISKDKIGSLDLSGHVQFENRLGYGARFGTHRQHDVALRYIHFSNAGIKKPNDGINMLLVVYSYKF